MLCLGFLQNLTGVLFVCYGFWLWFYGFCFSMYMCVSCVFFPFLLFFLFFACLFSEERERKMSWRWMGGKQAGSGRWGRGSHDQNMLYETFSVKVLSCFPHFASWLDFLIFSPPLVMYPSVFLSCGLNYTHPLFCKFSWIKKAPNRQCYSHLKLGQLCSALAPSAF